MERRDGVHVIYEELRGVNRARYFALTEQELSAQEALALGLVNEELRCRRSIAEDWARLIGEQVREEGL